MLSTYKSSVPNLSHQPAYSQQSLVQLLKTSGGRYYLIRCLLHMGGLRSLLYSIFKFLFNDEPPPYIEPESNDCPPPYQSSQTSQIKAPAPLVEILGPNQSQDIKSTSSSEPTNYELADIDPFNNVFEYISKNKNKFISHSYIHTDDSYRVKAYNFPIFNFDCSLFRSFSKPHEIVDIQYSNKKNEFTISYQNDIGESFKRIAELAKEQGFSGLDITLIKEDSLRSQARQQIETIGLEVIDRTPTLTRNEGFCPTAHQWTQSKWASQPI